MSDLALLLFMIGFGIYVARLLLINSKNERKYEEQKELEHIKAEAMREVKQILLLIPVALLVIDYLNEKHKDKN